MSLVYADASSESEQIQTSLQVLCCDAPGQVEEISTHKFVSSNLIFKAFLKRITPNIEFHLIAKVSKIVWVIFFYC